MLARLHIGHTRITHSYRLDRSERPQCATCRMDLTIGHLIKDCQEHEQLRTELFENKTPQEIFDSPHLVIKVRDYTKSNPMIFLGVQIEHDLQ